MRLIVKVVASVISAIIIVGIWTLCAEVVTAGEYQLDFWRSVRMWTIGLYIVDLLLWIHKYTNNALSEWDYS